MKELYLIRHGETDLNKKGIVQGRGVNSSLNETGRRQAAQFHEQYKEAGFEKIYISSLQRTYESIEPFVQMDIPVEKFAELDEISWGRHEGQVSGNSYREFHDLIKAWKQGQVSNRISGGESPLEVQERLQIFLKHLDQTEEKKVLICSHGRSIRILLCTLFNRTLQEMDAYPHHNLCLYVVRWDGHDARMIRENDLSHLHA